MALFDQVIKRPAVTVAVAIAIAALGAAGGIGLEPSPPSTKPALTANLIYARADAAEVERALINPLEARIASFRGVSKVESSARAGVATLTVWFEAENDAEDSSARLAAAAEMVATQLGSRVGPASIVRLDAQVASPSSVSARELAPTALAAAVLTLAVILTLVRSRFAALIVVAAVVLSSVATLGVLRPAKLGFDASSVVGAMLASILIVEATLRVQSAFNRGLAAGLQRRVAAQTAGIEIARTAPIVLAGAIALLMPFVVAAGDPPRFVRSIATMTIAGAVLAVAVAAPVVLALSLLWAGSARRIRKHSVLSGVVYAFDGRLDRLADRYHDILAWTLDRRRVAPVFALSVIVLGTIGVHGGQSIARVVDVGKATTFMQTDRPGVTLAVRGPDWRTLSGVAQRIAEELRGIGGIRSVHASAKSQDDGNIIMTDVVELSTDVSPARNRLAPEDDPELTPGSTPVQIDHLDGDRVVKIDAEVDGTATDVLSNVNARVAAVPLPPQYQVTIGGPLAERRRATGTTLQGFALGAAVLMVLLTLHLRSITSVLTVLITLCLTGLGSLGAISTTQLPFDISALVGAAAALALVSAHAITAVDYANPHHSAATSTRVLVIEAAQARFRPVVTTTLAGVATLLPLVGFGGVSTEAFSSLGLAALGGIVVGGIAVLFALPTVSIALTERFRRLRGEPLL